MSPEKRLSPRHSGRRAGVQHLVVHPKVEVIQIVQIPAPQAKRSAQLTLPPWPATLELKYCLPRCASVAHRTKAWANLKVSRLQSLSRTNSPAAPVNDGLQLLNPGHACAARVSKRARAEDDAGWAEDWWERAVSIAGCRAAMTHHRRERRKHL